MIVQGVLLERFDPSPLWPEWCSNGCGSLARWRGRNGLRLCGERVCLEQARCLQADLDADEAEHRKDGDRWQGVPEGGRLPARDVIRGYVASGAVDRG